MTAAAMASAMSPIERSRVSLGGQRERGSSSGGGRSPIVPIMWNGSPDASISIIVEPTTPVEAAAVAAAPTKAVTAVEIDELSFAFSVLDDEIPFIDDDAASIGSLTESLATQQPPIPLSAYYKVC